MTEVQVRVHHLPLDHAAPVVLVDRGSVVDAAVDSNRPEADDLLAVLLMSRYGSRWTLAPAAS